VPGVNRVLRVGVLGCGPIAQAVHLDACRKARNAELYAICDRADDLRERMAAVHRPAVAYRDYDAMLADPRVDAVLLAVADALPRPACLKALDAGKHVLVEKPWRRPSRTAGRFKRRPRHRPRGAGGPQPPLRPGRGFRA